MCCGVRRSTWLRLCCFVEQAFSPLGWRTNHYSIRYGRGALPIGIGGRWLRPLPHHRTYGSVYGGSTGYASDCRPMREVRARRDMHSTMPDPEPGSDSNATGHDENWPLAPPTSRSRPAVPVPHTACGRFSTVARKRSVAASGSTNPNASAPKGFRRNRNSLASLVDTGPVPPSSAPCSVPCSDA